MTAPLDLEADRQIAEVASSGPWIIQTGAYTGRDWLIGSSGMDGKDYSVHITTDHVHASDVGGDAKSDAEHIAHFNPSHVLALLAELERMRKAAEAADMLASLVENMKYPYVVKDAQGHNLITDAELNHLARGAKAFRAALRGEA